jgi:hypothetical protein
MAGYVGNIPVPQATQTRQSFTATASQTSFPTIGYTEGFFDCHLNGVKLLAGVDFNVGGGNGSDVILATGAALNDILEVTIFDTFNTSSGTFSSTTLKNNVTLKNDTHEDSDGGRASKIIYQGEQSGGEISTLAEIQASHDLAADDQKGDLIFRTNDGADGTSPTEAMRITSQQRLGLGIDDPSDDFEIKPSADEKGITLKTPDSIRPYLNFDANRSGANQQVMRLQGKWNGNTITRFETSTGDDTSNKDNGYFTFQTATSSSDLNTRVRIDEHGIKFGSDTGEDNGLSDYERGLHTISINQGGIGFHSLYQNFQYIKIGDFVNVHGLCLVTSSGDSNDLRINMPFTSKSGLTQTADATHGLVSSYNAPTGTGGMRCTISKGTSQLRFLKTVDNGVWTSLLGNELANNDHLYINITYEVA